MSHTVRPLTLDDAVCALLSFVDSRDAGPEVSAALRSTAEQLLRRTSPSTPWLAPGQRRYLLESGAFSPAEFADTEDRVARGELRESEQRTALQVIADSYGESEVADMLSVSGDEVRSLGREGALFAFDAAGIMVYPKWQFTDRTHDVGCLISRRWCAHFSRTGTPRVSKVS